MGRKRKTIEDYYELALSRSFIWLGPKPTSVLKKSLWQCSKDHQWEARFSTIQGGQGCPYCAGVVSKPVEDYYNLAKSRGYNWLGPEVSSVHKKTWWQCSKGHQWEAPFNNIRQGWSCPYCVKGHVPKSIIDYHSIATEKNFIWLGVKLPSTIKAKTLWQCSKGHQWEARYNDIQQGHGCPYCAGGIQKIPQDYHDLAQKRGFVWLGPEVRRNIIKTEWKCAEGHQWQATYSHIQQGRGCPYCFNQVQKIPQDYHDLAQKRGFVWLGPEVRTTIDKTWWECSKSHKWEARFSSIQTGRGCPVCLQSKGEEIIAKFLGEHGIKYNQEKRFDKCRYEATLSFDFYFYLDAKHFLVEYDGLQHFKAIDYWGGKEGLRKTQIKDAIKNKFAQDNNFILIRISYTVKNVSAYLQLELERYLSFPLDKLRNLPQEPQSKIKPLNPYQWKQGVLL